jgi:hypothetical protein
VVRTYGSVRGMRHKPHPTRSTSPHLETQLWRRLNGELEKRLPAQMFYAAEWMALGEGKSYRKYIPLSLVETSVPVIFIYTYFTNLYRYIFRLGRVDLWCMIFNLKLPNINKIISRLWLTSCEEAQHKKCWASALRFSTATYNNNDI